MGATLPVLSRFFVRSFAQFGRRVGDLYATNTLGAVIGCAAGGFFLIPILGMRATVFVAARCQSCSSPRYFDRRSYAGQEPLELHCRSGKRKKLGQPTAEPRHRGWLWVLLGFFRFLRIRLVGL